MYFILVLVLLAGTVNGVPLESPSQDLSGFFTNSRIVGGVDAPESYLHYQAALVFGHNIPSFTCGGSIISHFHILTAAHCIDPFITWTGEMIRSFHARIGSNKWNEGGVRLEFKSHRNHPQWEPWTLKYDAGILTLLTEIQFSATVGPIPLGSELTDGGEKCYVTGWGVTEAWGSLPRVLQLLYVNTISTKECVERIRVIIGEWGWAPPVYAHTEICTFVSYGKGMCHGDSGSALVSVRNKKQIGIVSWGFPCAVGAPDMYTRIDSAMDLITEVLNEIS